MELGKVANFKITLDPIDVKEISDETNYSSCWRPETSYPGWCTDEQGIVIGIDVDSPTRFSYPPKVLPKMKFKTIQFLVGYLNPDEVASKFTLGFINRKGKMVERTIKSEGHKLGRACFDISIIDLDPEKLFRSKLLVVPDCGIDQKLFISGVWLEINTEV